MAAMAFQAAVVESEKVDPFEVVSVIAASLSKILYVLLVSTRPLLSSSETGGRP